MAKNLIILGALFFSMHAFAQTEEAVVLEDTPASSASHLPKPSDVDRSWAWAVFPAATLLMLGLHLRKSPFIRVKVSPPLDSLLPPPDSGPDATTDGKLS